MSTDMQWAGAKTVEDAAAYVAALPPVQRGAVQELLGAYQEDLAELLNGLVDACCDVGIEGTEFLPFLDAWRLVGYLGKVCGPEVDDA